MKIGIAQPQRRGDTIGGLPPHAGKPPILRRAVDCQATGHLTRCLALLVLPDQRVRLARTAPGQPVSRRPCTDGALLEDRREHGAVSGSGCRHNRKRQAGGGELIESPLVASGVKVVRASPASAVVRHPDCGIVGVRWIAGDVHPRHPQSLPQEFVEPLLVGGCIYAMVGDKHAGSLEGSVDWAWRVVATVAKLIADAGVAIGSKPGSVEANLRSTSWFSLQDRQDLFSFSGRIAQCLLAWTNRPSL